MFKFFVPQTFLLSWNFSRSSKHQINLKKEYGKLISFILIYAARIFHFTDFRFVFNRYSLIPKGSAPGVSVGHTCTFIQSVNEGKGRIIIVGGANPSGSFSDSHIINLGKGIFVESMRCLISMFDLNYLTDFIGIIRGCF